MLRISSLRFSVITLILFAFAAIVANANWGRFCFSLFEPEAVAKEISTGASQPLLPTAVPISLPNTTGATGYIVTVPVTIGDLTGLEVNSYQFSVGFDPTVLQALPPETAGTLTSISGWGLSSGQFTGHMSAVAWTGSTNYLVGAGTLLNLKFLVVGSPGQSTTLRFNDYSPLLYVYSNSTELPLAITQGSLTVVAASASPTPSNTATPLGSPGSVPVPVSLPNVSAVQGSNITIPISTGNMNGLGACCYDLQITYDPAVLQPAGLVADTSGTMSSGMALGVNTNVSGHLVVSAGGGSGFQLTGWGTLINLRFTVVGTSGQSTALTFENYMDPANYLHPGFSFNEGNPSSTTTNGSVSVGAGGGAAIAGTVKYGNAIGGQTTRFVPNVLLDGAGSTGVWTMTDLADGNYSLFGFGSGAYIVSPSKAGGVNGAISSFDAAKIAQQVAGVGVLTGTQMIVADVSSNGSVSSFDAGQIARYVAGIHDAGTTAKWRFNPASRSYASVATVTGEDYSALLMGEVSGNWINSGGRPAVNRSAGGPERNVSVTTPRLVAKSNTEVLIPVAIQGAGKKGLISYEFDLRYDPGVIQPQAVAADLRGTVSHGLSVVTNVIDPGLLRVVVYGPMPINNDGVLLNLRFTAVGKPGSISPLSFERIMLNEGEPRVNATAGQVELF